MTDDSLEGRFTDGRGGRRARRMALLTVLVFIAMLVALSWYQLSDPTPSPGGAPATPGADGVPAAPPEAP